jgi:hypothetical protein
MISDFKPCTSNTTKRFLRQLLVSGLIPSTNKPKNKPTPAPALYDSRRQLLVSKEIDQTFCRRVATNLIRKQRESRQRQESVREAYRHLERLQLVAAALRELVVAKQKNCQQKPPSIIDSVNAEGRHDPFHKIYPYYKNVLSPWQIEQVCEAGVRFPRQFVKKGGHHHYEDENDLHAVVKLKHLHNWLLQFLEPKSTLERVHKGAPELRFNVSLKLFLYLDDKLKLNGLLYEE